MQVTHHHKYAINTLQGFEPRYFVFHSGVVHHMTHDLGTFSHPTKSLKLYMYLHVVRCTELV